jgi:hypothetical protein
MLNMEPAEAGHTKIEFKIIEDLLSFWKHMSIQRACVIGYFKLKSRSLLFEYNKNLNLP